jgi:hypothetical protein
MGEPGHKLVAPREAKTSYTIRIGSIHREGTIIQ